jgi:hypothetical protein
VNDPGQIIRALEELPLWETALLTVERGQPNMRILLVPAWDALATLVVTRESEWAMVSSDLHYDCSPSGDSLVGWQINRGPAVTPVFQLAGELRTELRRPDILRDLFTSMPLE